ncbi:MAG: hypothetical protein HQM12_01110 [SAR324 cluster bacterium]|nr:hypothetical protein [SAR324 cluster bacterium]MBF0353114.1 hypothetical protein [SAR324 cluster bacterium]
MEHQAYDIQITDCQLLADKSMIISVDIDSTWGICPVCGYMTNHRLDVRGETTMRPFPLLGNTYIKVHPPKYQCLECEHHTVFDQGMPWFPADSGISSELEEELMAFVELSCFLA